MKDFPSPSFLLVVKAGHAGALALARIMRSWLETRRASAAILAADAPAETLRAAAAGRSAVIVLGGDGTVVGVCRRLAGLGSAAPPYMGVNFGQVGFLAEVPPDGWEAWLERLLAGTLCARPRLCLAWEARGHAGVNGLAVNDVVVGRGSLARVLPVRVVVEDPDGEEHDLGWVRSDGMVISTPQGTSAYALSAHGALLHPDVRGLAVTPVSPFFKSFPAMVLPPERGVRLETAPRAPFPAENAGRDEEGPLAVDAFLTVDGQEGFALAPGDAVTVRCLDAGLSQMTLPHDSYFGRLGERGFLRTGAC